jgi:hypothetical protein
MPTSHRIARLILLAVVVPAAAQAATSISKPTTAKDAATPSDHYFVMKQVKIVDQNANQGQGLPAYDLMIPTSWQFKGWVNVGVAEGGCFADWFAVVGDAKSPDNSIELQIIPQYTFQYVTDPDAQRHLQQENQKDRQVGMKPCPVRMPVHAADFIRQDMIEKYRKGKTVVSVDPFPELNQIARHRLGLPADGTGNPGGIHTEAARARLSYNDDKGQPVEEWVTAVILVRALQSGRGVAYDWHAIYVMSLRTPQGKLDANDKVFKLIASTIQTQPQWQTYSSGVIASLYKKKQIEEAKQSQIIAEFQNKVAQTINGVTANSMRGADNAAFGESQIIRGVQTFRDPSTGSTFELSNQYDHAWRNGSNEYVMSDDPNFNPNAQLNGSWNELQVVHPQP